VVFRAITPRYRTSRNSATRCEPAPGVLETNTSRARPVFNSGKAAGITTKRLRKWQDDPGRWARSPFWHRDPGDPPFHPRGGGTHAASSFSSSVNYGSGIYGMLRQAAIACPTTTPKKTKNGIKRADSTSGPPRRFWPLVTIVRPVILEHRCFLIPGFRTQRRLSVAGLDYWAWPGNSNDVLFGFLESLC